MFAAAARASAATAVARTRPLPMPPIPHSLRAGTSNAAPVHIDESDSDETESTSAQSTVTDLRDNDAIEDVEMEDVEHLTQISESSVDRRDMPSRSLSPVSRLHGFEASTAAIDSIAARSDNALPSASLATNSSPSTTTRRRHHHYGRNVHAEFFKSVRSEILQPSPPAKSSLKRPLDVTRRASSNDVTSQIGYKSSSDSSDAEDYFALNTIATDSNSSRHTGGGNVNAKSIGPLQSQPPKKRKAAGPPLDFFLPASQMPFPPAAAVALVTGTDAPIQREPIRVWATRAQVCGRLFGRCELLFGVASVELVLWRDSDSNDSKSDSDDKCVWHGALAYTHLERFSFYRGLSAPYLLLLELRASEQGGHLRFSEFFDSLVAQSAHEQRAVPVPNLFGAALYFDHEIDFVQCTSLVDSIAALQTLANVPIPDTEARRYLDAAAAAATNNNNSSNDAAQARPLSQRTSVASSLTIGFKSVVSSLFSASTASSAGSNRPATAASNSTESSSTGRASNNSTSSSSSQSIDKFFVRGSTRPQPSAPSSSESALDRSAVVEIDDPSQPAPGTDAIDSVDGRTDHSGSGLASADNSSTTTTDSTQPPLKTATLLTYPFEDAESSVSAGKIAVTYGDIARLAPGEFLNDSIIDLYLRFLWRHQCHSDQLYVYSSHFFTQLLGSSDATANVTAADRFARVARWTHKEPDLFAKQFLFIPINDSFHWSIAVFCNPGSAVVRSRRRHRQVEVQSTCSNSNSSPQQHRDVPASTVVDLVDNFSAFRDQPCGTNSDKSTTDVSNVSNRRPLSDADWVEVRDEIIDEPVEEFEQMRHDRPPCLLFLDSLKCHRKKKFTALLREYLSHEWASRNCNSNNDKQAMGSSDATVVERFDADAITLIEPNVPMQTNSSDCGVFVLVYAAEVARRFPGGVTREDVATHFAATLSPSMFTHDHVTEFREYVHQLIFCLRSLQRRGLREELVEAEELDRFVIDD